MRSIVFSGQEPPRLTAVPSLSGKLAPAATFKRVYAIHHSLGIIFSCATSADGTSYQLNDLVPGSYDLFIVGNREIVFYLTPPPLQRVLDKKIRLDSREFLAWLGSPPHEKLPKIPIYVEGALFRHQSDYSGRNRQSAANARETVLFMVMRLQR